MVPTAHVMYHLLSKLLTVLKKYANSLFYAENHDHSEFGITEIL